MKAIKIKEQAKAIKEKIQTLKTTFALDRCEWAFAIGWKRRRFRFNINEPLYHLKWVGRSQLRHGCLFNEVRTWTSAYNCFYRPKRGFGQGNVFTGVCHSVNRGGVPDQVHPLQSGTPPSRYIPRAGTPPWQVHPPPVRYTPQQVHPRAGTPPRAGTSSSSQVHLPSRYTPRAGTPPWQVHPLAGTPLWQVHAPARCTPLPGTPPAGTPPWAGTPPGQVHSPPSGRYTLPEYGQRSAGTHPTGMHSCSFTLT